MPTGTSLNFQELDLPACPRALVQLSLLLSSDTVPMTAIAELIETDMALASAVVRSVNSSLYGLSRRVETVGDAVRYLGTSEVTALTFEIGLRGAFPPTPELELLWERASRRGLLMGRTALALDLDALRAHTAGLFSRSGQAVLLARAPQPYALLMRRHEGDPAALAQAELDAFGLTQATLGSALCRAWGLAGDIADYVREHVRPAAEWGEQTLAVRQLLVLGAVVDALLEGRDPLPVAESLGEWSDLPPARLVDVVLPQWERLRAVQ